MAPLRCGHYYTAVSSCCVTDVANLLHNVLPGTVSVLHAIQHCLVTNCEVDQPAAALDDIVLCVCMSLYCMMFAQLNSTGQLRVLTPHVYRQSIYVLLASSSVISPI